jgi:hypothetical protein
MNIEGAAMEIDGESLTVRYSKAPLTPLTEWRYVPSKELYKCGTVWRSSDEEVAATIKAVIDGQWISELSPSLMIKFGVFDGCYFRTDPSERRGLPLWWFNTPNYNEEKENADNNYFKISASQPLATWKDNGWLPQDYKLGHFHWQCFYFLGKTKDPEVDRKQIARAKSFIARQGGKNIDTCEGDLTCKPRLRQSLLNWGSSRAFA